MLGASKYAPATPAQRADFSREAKLKQDKAKAERLLGRLRWKAQSILAAYVRARDIVFTDPGSNNGHAGAVGHGYIFVWGISSVRCVAMDSSVVLTNKG